MFEQTTIRHGPHQRRAFRVILCVAFAGLLLTAGATGSALANSNEQYTWIKQGNQHTHVGSGQTNVDQNYADANAIARQRGRDLSQRQSQAIFQHNSGRQVGHDQTQVSSNRADQTSVQGQTGENEEQTQGQAAAQQSAGLQRGTDNEQFQTSNAGQGQAQFQTGENNEQRQGQSAWQAQIQRHLREEA